MVIIGHSYFCVSTLGTLWNAMQSYSIVFGGHEAGATVHRIELTVCKYSQYSFFQQNGKSSSFHSKSGKAESRKSMCWRKHNPITC